MIVYAKLTLAQIDNAAVKGSELDSEIQEALINLDVEGYEVTQAEVDRSNIKTAEAKREVGIAELEERNKAQLASCVQAIQAGRANEPSQLLEGKTVAEAMAWVVDELVIKGHRMLVQF